MFAQKQGIWGGLVSAARGFMHLVHLLACLQGRTACTPHLRTTHSACMHVLWCNVLCACLQVHTRLITEDMAGAHRSAQGTRLAGNTGRLAGVAQIGEGGCAYRMPCCYGAPYDRHTAHCML